MNKLLYPRLAAQNIGKNAKFYIPYLLTILGAAAAFYITAALSHAEDLPRETRYAYLSMFMSIGTFVIAVFAVVFLCYTNSFLMKRRKKELGLYNILGMGKRHIAIILALETVYLAAAGIGGGLFFGIVLQRLVSMLMCRLMRFPTYFSAVLSPRAMTETALLFGGILLFTLLANLRQGHIQSPVALMREGGAGEREPKTRWLLAVLGVVSLAAAYTIAVVVKSAFLALAYYFIAVFLVILGTYCLFTAVSIAVLKLLRANKKFYYQTTHFIGISGMLYRMKRNAVGLANICILSTMVLVMVSGTLALYLGSEDVIDGMFPGELNVSVEYSPSADGAFDPELAAGQMTEEIRRQAPDAAFVQGYQYLYLDAVQTGDAFMVMDGGGQPDSALIFLTADNYAAMTGESVPPLAGDEALVSRALDADTLRIDFQAGGGTESVRLRVSPRSEALTRAMAGRRIGTMAMMTLEPIYVVVPNEDTLLRLYEKQAARRNIEYMRWAGSWSVGGSPDEQSALGRRMEEALAAFLPEHLGSYYRLMADTRANFEEEYYALNGGFFFLGAFLGLIFLMATALIIYYKQISEGYEDCERYRVMQKVGLEKRMVRRAVNAQVLVVFFLPLLVAAVHVAFDFGLMARLLTLFGLHNLGLTLACTGGTFVAFALVYGAVYLLTARVYYRIVE